MTSQQQQKKSLLEKWRSEKIPEEILKAFEVVPREAFITSEQANAAYDDRPLPIGHNQTISQPTTVMNMLNLLKIESGQNVLEIGAGSGYVCALLAELGCIVTGVEIVPELSVSASKVLSELGYNERVHLYTADGGNGWQETAPFDRILLSAASPSAPEHLFSQLVDGGLLVAPVGSVEQRLMVYSKEGSEIKEKDHGAYVFVPLVGEYGVGEDMLPGMPMV